ncbi:MAG: TetR/AcrR family transcriptional regulator [Phaeodactylibacter sp.]|nr:TetR/AcrR family transcriptional regulator [Phaeodactylibacter sp.]
MKLTTGRISQKLKTRQALIDATRDLLANGDTFTIEDVAKTAEVSRATVYRYFSNVDTLILEAGVLHRSPITSETMVEFEGKDVVERMGYLQELMFRYVSEEETSFRKLLSILVTQNGHAEGKRPYTRGGWRVGYIEDAIGPCRDHVAPEDYNKLKIALATLIGIESLVVGKDVCRQEDADVQQALNWAVKTLVTAVCSSGQ